MKKKVFSFIALCAISTLSFGQMLEIKRVGSFIYVKQNETSYFIAESTITSIVIGKDEETQGARRRQGAVSNQDNTPQQTQQQPQPIKTKTKITIYTSEKQSSRQDASQDGRPMPIASSQDSKNYSFVINESEVSTYLEKMNQVLNTSKP